jgi:hypothetical protein
MRTRIRILKVNSHITSLDCDYEIINRKGDCDTVAGTLTEYSIPVMSWENKANSLNIAKAHMRAMGFVVER